MEQINVKDYVKEWLQVIAKALSIKNDSLCFCGSGKVYGKCCLQKPENETIFCEDIFEKTIKHRDSQGGKIDYIPVGTFQKMKKNSINRLNCLYPECNEKPCRCHLIPENILEKSFGSFCLEFQLKDGPINQKYKRKGKNNAGTLLVFCEKHDNDLFKKIDDMKIDFGDKEQLFLLAFKSICFSFRKVQYLLGIDTQAQLFAPKRILENPNNTLKEGDIHDINISHLQGQYIRFSIIHNVLNETIKALENKDWEFFSYFYRSIKYKNNIFSAGFINLSHDLKNIRINNIGVPINMTYNIFTESDKLHVILSCPGVISQKAYADFFQQLHNVDEETFIAVINNILNISTNRPLLPIGFPIGDDVLIKIKNIMKYYEDCMRSTSKNIFDLKDNNLAFQFIKK